MMTPCAVVRGPKELEAASLRELNAAYDRSGSGPTKLTVSIIGPLSEA